MEEQITTHDNLMHQAEIKGEFDAAKVEQIRRAWSKGRYTPNAEIIARLLFD